MRHPRVSSSVFAALWLSVELTVVPLPVVQAQSQSSAPVAAAAPDQPEEPARSSDPVEPAAPEQLETPAPSPAATKANPGVEQVRLRLQAAQQERARASVLLPWLVVGTGAATLVVAAASGAVKAMACDGRCATPNWVALTVMIGAGVATLGTVWLLRRHADLRALDSHVYHLEQELERVRLSRAGHEPANRSTAQLSWRFVL